MSRWWDWSRGKAEGSTVSEAGVEERARKDWYRKRWEIGGPPSFCFSCPLRCDFLSLLHRVHWINLMPPLSALGTGALRMALWER